MVMFIGEVSDGESLFFNAGRRKRQTAPDADFIPTFFDELNITEAERIVCEDNDQCLFDLAATGDMTFALTTLDHQKEANATKEVLSMSMNMQTFDFVSFNI